MNSNNTNEIRIFILLLLARFSFQINFFLLSLSFPNMENVSYIEFYSFRLAMVYFWIFASKLTLIFLTTLLEIKFFFVAWPSMIDCRLKIKCIYHLKSDWSRLGDIEKRNPRKVTKYVDLSEWFRWIRLTLTSALSPENFYCSPLTHFFITTDWPSYLITFNQSIKRIKRFK